MCDFPMSISREPHLRKIGVDIRAWIKEADLSLNIGPCSSIKVKLLNHRGLQYPHL